MAKFTNPEIAKLLNKFRKEHGAKYAYLDEKEKGSGIMRDFEDYLVTYGDTLRAELDAATMLMEEKPEEQGLTDELKAKLAEDVGRLAAEVSWTADPKEQEAVVTDFLARANSVLVAVMPSQNAAARRTALDQVMEAYYAQKMVAYNYEEHELTPAIMEMYHSQKLLVLSQNVKVSQKLDSVETELYRERSADSDANEFLLDQVKLQALLDMGVITQQIYDAGVQKSSAAIEAINSKRRLNDKEQAQFEDITTKYMMNNEMLFGLLPPSVLAKKYVEFNQNLQSILRQNPQADVRAEEAAIAKLAGRMDGLSSDLYQKRGLFFADVTNISDTYDGYMQMFAAREADIDDAGKQVIAANRNVLDELISEYDREWNLENVAKADAAKIDQRFAALSQNLENTELDEETMRQLSNFKFLDADGKAEPQFVDANGNASDSWQPGALIIEGSKLENVVRIARQNVLMSQLGSSEEVNIPMLNAALKEELPQVLYAAHVANQVDQGIKENLKQFTDRKYLNSFIADLRNIEKPMAVSATAYDASVDSCINSVGAFAHRLGAKVGKDSPVVTKLFEPLKNLDKRAADRTSGGVDKRSIRIEMLKRTAKGAASAFLVSGAITVAATATAADASLTAATLGFNKYAGMAVGTALAVTMTVRQIRRWRKERKEAGEKRGLGALIKDRRMMMTIGTTALGATALGFAITGNPGVAQVLGYSSLALGSANGIINNTQDALKNGLGGWEAAGWATLQTVATVGAGFAGRFAANQGISLYNKHNPDNDIFQHRGIVGQHQETVTHTEAETVYKPGVVENAGKILDYWYNDNPDLLQQRIDAIETYNAEHGTDINPQRYLLAAHDAGALTADNNMLHVQGGADVNSNANHKVFGEGWSQASGVSQQTVNALAGSVNGDGVSLSAESIKAFQEIDNHISASNQVGHVAGNPHQDDGVLGFNAKLDANGQSVSANSGSQYTTYANHDGVTDTNIKETVVTTNVDDYGMIRNQTDLGLGMFGVLGRKISGLKKLKERAGSLLDRAVDKDKKATNMVSEAEKGDQVQSASKKEGQAPKTKNAQRVVNPKTQGR